MAAVLSLLCARTVPGMEMPEESLEDLISLEDYLEAQNYQGQNQEDEVSSDEIDQIIEKYMEQIENGNLGTGEDVDSQKITDPPLKAERAGNGGVRYLLPNGIYFISSVPDGMISHEPVEFVLPGEILGVVKKDDGQTAVPGSWVFTEPGVYDVTLLFYQPPDRENLDYNVYEIHFSFTIIGRTTGNLGAVPAPEGFEIAGVRKDGRTQQVKNLSCVFLEGDGRYEVQYKQKEPGNLRFNTVFIRDTTAPFLSFSQDPGAGAMTAPVNFIPSEPGCRVSMSYNGNKSYVLGTTLTAAGNYELAVEDAAGNQRFYHLRIRQTYKLVDYRLIMITFLVLAAVTARLLFLRRSMKVL